MKIQAINNFNNLIYFSSKKKKQQKRQLKVQSALEKDLMSFQNGQNFLKEIEKLDKKTKKRFDSMYRCHQYLNLPPRECASLAYAFCQIDDDKYNFLKDKMKRNSNFTPQYAKDFAYGLQEAKDTKTYEKAYDMFLKSKIRKDDVILFADLKKHIFKIAQDEELFEKYNKIVHKGANITHAFEITYNLANEDELDFVIEESKKYLPKTSIMRIIRLANSKELKAKYDNLIKENVSKHTALDWAFSDLGVDKDTLEIVKKYSKDVYFGLLNTLLNQYDIQTVDKIATLIQNDVDSSTAIRLAMNEDISQNLKMMTFQQKSRLLSSIIKNSAQNPQYETKELTHFKKLLIDSLKMANIEASASKEEISALFKNLLSNNDKKLDKTLKNFDFSKYNKTGLPLEYSRNEYIGDLNKLTKNLEENGKREIFELLEIKPTISNGEIIGYDGFLDYNNLNEENKTQKEIKKITKKFLENNNIKTGNKTLDDGLNSFISAIKPFINIIGKKQSPTHASTLDVHIFHVLQEAIKNPEFENLSNQDKTITKFAILLHDISKNEFKPDLEHPEKSAIITKKLLENYPLPKEMKNRIFEHVLNHQWLMLYSNNKYDEYQLATLFRTKQDWKITKIITNSDLKSVNPDFYAYHYNDLDNENLEIVDKTLEIYNQSGQIIYPSNIINEEKIPTIDYKGKKLKLINFSKMSENQDMEKYGFQKGIKRKNLRFLSHVTSNLDELSFLLNSGIEPMLCATFNTAGAKYDKVYSRVNNNYIIAIVEAPIENIANAHYQNQGSGRKKDIRFFSSIHSGNKQTYRYFIPDSIKKELEIDNEDYGILFEKLISKRKITQIKNNEIFELKNKVLKGEEVKKAILKAQNDFLDASKSSSNNEVNLFNPKIVALAALSDDIKNVQEKHIDYAIEKNIPIFLF